MKAQLFDTEKSDSSWNGMVLESPQQLRAMLAEVQSQSRLPFFAELVGHNGHQLLLGLGALDGCVQFSSTDGAPPYLMAVGQNEKGRDHLVFSTGGTPTPVLRRYGLPMQAVTDIAVFFMETGERLSNIIWEPVGPV